MGRSRGRAGSKFDAEAVREVPTPLRRAAGSLEEVMRRLGVDEAWEALEQMHLEGKTTDKYTVSRMLMKTVGDGHLDPTRAYRGISLVERFIEMQPEDVDEVLFNALLDTCCRLKDLKRLESCMNWMRRLQVKPSPITLGILVKTYGQAGDLEKVLAAWDEMEEQRGLANSVTYGCMLDACVKCGNLQKAVEVFQGMRATGKHRNTILYTTMIKGYGLHKELESALELFHEMPREGVPYNTITYNSILEACVKCGDVASAEEILNQMLRVEMDIVPDLISYSTVLKGYCQNGDLPKALCMFEGMKENSLRCDELVYNTLMEGCVKADDWKTGIGHEELINIGCNLFCEMVRKGLRPSAITASILSRLFQRVGHEDCDEKVAELFAMFQLEKPQPGERRQRKPPRLPASPGVWSPNWRRQQRKPRLPPSPGVVEQESPARRPSAFSPTLSSPGGLGRSLMATLEAAPLPTGRVVPTEEAPRRPPPLSSLLPEEPARWPMAPPLPFDLVEGHIQVTQAMSSPAVRPPPQPSLASLLHEEDQGSSRPALAPLLDARPSRGQESVTVEVRLGDDVASLDEDDSDFFVDVLPGQLEMLMVSGSPAGQLLSTLRSLCTCPVQFTGLLCHACRKDASLMQDLLYPSSPNVNGLCMRLQQLFGTILPPNLCIMDQNGSCAYWQAEDSRPTAPQKTYYGDGREQRMVARPCEEARVQKPSAISPAVRAPVQQPSLASLLHEDEGRRQMPPLASLLGPLEGARPSPSHPSRPVERDPVAVPTPRRSAITPPEGWDALEAEPKPLPLSPATMLLGEATPCAPARDDLRPCGSSDPFQSFFSQDMWSYFSDGPPRW